MNSYNVNKIAGAVLWSALVIVGSKVLIEEISIPKHPEKPGYVVEIPGEKLAAKPADTGHGNQAEASKPEASKPIETAAVADEPGNAAKGAKVAKKCGGCHTFKKGGATRVGPNLWGIVNRKVASMDGARYSDALKAKGGNWTLAELECFIASPKKCVPKTSMSFRGIRKPGKLADLLAYLKELK